MAPTENLPATNRPLHDRYRVADHFVDQLRVAWPAELRSGYGLPNLAIPGELHRVGPLIGRGRAGAFAAAVHPAPFLISPSFLCPTSSVCGQYGRSHAPDPEISFSSGRVGWGDGPAQQSGGTDLQRKANR